MRAFLSIIVAVICCSSVLAGSAPALEETPHYLRSKEAFIEHFIWLPEGLYMRYGVINFEDRAPATDFLEEVRVIESAARDYRPIPGVTLIRSVAYHALFAEAMQIKPVPYDTTGTKDLPENWTEETLEQKQRKRKAAEERGELPENSSLPFSMKRERILLYSVPDANGLKKNLLKKGYAESVGQTEVNSLDAISMPMDTPEAGTDTYYGVVAAPDLLLFAQSKKLLNDCIAARYGLRESMVDDDLIQVAAEYRNLLYPSFGIVDQRHMEEQTIVQFVRMGMTREEAEQRAAQQNSMQQPRVMLFSTRYGDESYRSRSLFIFPGEETYKNDSFYANLQQRKQQLKQQSKTADREFVWVEEDDYLYFETERTYAESLKKSRAAVEKYLQLMENTEQSENK